MLDPGALFVIIAIFVIAGLVKGVTGLGLPTVSLGLLVAILDLPTAMALLLVPSFAANLWQAAVGGHARDVFFRIWPFLLAACSTVWIGALALDHVDIAYLSALLGMLLIIYASVGLLGVQLSIARAREKRLGVVFGLVNGVLTGMTGSFTVPGVMFLQAIGLPRDKLIQAMGMLFLASTVALALALGGNSRLTWELGGLSALSVIPAGFGIVLGQKVRSRLSERLFRKIFLAALLLLGLYVTVRALVASL